MYGRFYRTAIFSLETQHQVTYSPSRLTVRQLSFSETRHAHPAMFVHYAVGCIFNCGARKTAYPQFFICARPDFKGHGGEHYPRLLEQVFRGCE